MRGECRDCTKHGHLWVDAKPRTLEYAPTRYRRCARCGIRQHFSFSWTRRHEAGEVWTPDTPKRYLTIERVVTGPVELVHWPDCHGGEACSCAQRGAFITRGVGFFTESR